MASRLELLADSIVTRLSAITVANGYPFDLIAEHALVGGNDLAGDVALTRHRAIVLASAERLDLKAFHSHARAAAEISVDLFPAASAVDTPVKSTVDPVRVAVAMVMLAGIAEDPPFGIAGVEDAELRWEIFRLEQNAMVGATVTVSVTYRHDLDNPQTYGGSP